MNAEETSLDEPPGGRPEGARASSGLDIEVIDADGRLGEAAARWVRAMADRAGRELGASGEVRVRVVGDAEMAAAHALYKGVKGTTDVLTFELGEGPELDTDIMVCIDEAIRRSGELGHPPEREVLLYVVHGMLHCMGFDDGTREEAARMHRREDEVLTAIGVGATYAPAGDAGGGERC